MNPKQIKRIFKLKHGFSLTELAIKIARAAQDIATLREAAHMWLADNGKMNYSEMCIYRFKD